MVGLSVRIANATGADQTPAVKETLGRISAQEAMIAAMVHGQIDAFEAWPGGSAGYVCFNCRMMYGALEWCTQNYSRFVEDLRELCGGGVFQMPADISVMKDPELARDFQSYWQTPQLDAVARMKLFKLAWDIVGSEFAGRHQQYEKFYAGASFIVRNHSFREADWAGFNAIVEALMATYDHADAFAKTAAE
jgi:4-hydroxyphenylacetate 3-monooxygenase